MSRRCAWCNGTRDPLVEVAAEQDGGSWPREHPALLGHPEHLDAIRRYVNGVATRRKTFVALMLLFQASFVLGVVGSILGAAGGRLLAAGSVAALGLVALSLPFATPQTVRRVGIRRSRLFARIGGVVLLALAAGLMGAG